MCLLLQIYIFLLLQCWGLFPYTSESKGFAFCYIYLHAFSCKSTYDTDIPLQGKVQGPLGLRHAWSASLEVHV